MFNGNESAPDPGLADIDAARRRIAGTVDRTPLLRGRALDTATGAEAWLKAENLQVTGSFKARGAANKILSLPLAARRRGIVACSSGNHALAVAYVAAKSEVAATVCVPSWIDPVKLEAIRGYGAQVVLAGDTYDEAEEEAERRVAEGLEYVHPFDDPLVIAGQGTIGAEILDDLPDLDCVVVPLSGGGLFAGVATAVKSRHPTARAIAVAAEKASVMATSLQAGQPLDLPEEETIATALSGGIGLANRYTFRMVAELADEVVTVGEEEIVDAMAFALSRLHLLVEGGGAVGLAAILAGRISLNGGRVAVVVSGGNIDLRNFWDKIEPRIGTSVW